jgi:hypothetical protein
MTFINDGDKDTNKLIEDIEYLLFQHGLAWHKETGGVSRVKGVQQPLATYYYKNEFKE